MIKMTLDEWRAEAERRFGAEPMSWRFVCPSCGHVASVADYRLAGAPEGAVGFSCVGRWTGAKREAFAKSKRKGPCNYAGGGLFRLNPVRVTKPDGETLDVFEFAPTAEPATVEQQRPARKRA